MCHRASLTLVLTLLNFTGRLITALKFFIMKWLIILLFPFSASAQYTYIISADSTKLRRVGGNNELIIENSTRATTGVLVNYGNGRTRFSKPRINGDTLFIGMDTLVGLGTPGWSLTGNTGTNPASNFIGTTDAVDLVFKTNNVQIARFPSATGSAIGHTIFIGELAGDGNTAVGNVYAIGFRAAQNNTGLAVNAIGQGAGRGNSGEDFNGFGVDAGRNNTGRAFNGMGVSAGESNTADNLNVFGENAGVGNTGTNVNIFGFSGGTGNAFSNVTLLGAEAEANADGQLVFNTGVDIGGGSNARLGFGAITANRLYRFPDSSGTIALLSNTTTPTWQQTLTAGSTLTTNNTVDADLNDFSMVDIGTLQFRSGTASVPNTVINMDDAAGQITSARAGAQSSFHVQADSIDIKPHLGYLTIDTLTFAPGTKALRYNPTTGLVSYADTSSASAGGTPAGNYGNIQINRNGAFATPASDSLGYTTGSGLVVKNNMAMTGAGRVFSMYNGVSGNAATVNQFNWGDNYDGVCFYFYDGGGGSRGGAGFRPSNWQTFIANNWYASWNKGGDLQTAGTNEMFRIDANADKVSIKTTNFQITTFGAGTLVTDGSGNVTATSDARVKHDINPFLYGLDAIRKIDPATFVYNQDGTNTVMPGFIAQNVQEAIPVAVNMGKDGMLTLNSNAIIAALVNAVKELEARVIELEKK
jgi:hypothetical protein